MTGAPTTPDGRARDVLTHVVGVNADILEGNLEGVGTDWWTAAQAPDGDAVADAWITARVADVLDARDEPGLVLRTDFVE